MLWQESSWPKTIRRCANICSVRCSGSAMKSRRSAAAPRRCRFSKTERFDLLLTDIVMPEMDGIELAQKASALDPAIRVMFITGFAAVALQGGRTAPEAKLLSKPFHLKDLVMEVDRMFQTEDQHGRL